MPRARRSWTPVTRSTSRSKRSARATGRAGSAAFWCRATTLRRSPGRITAVCPRRSYRPGWRLACQHPVIDAATYIHPAVDIVLKTVTSAEIGDIKLYPNVQKHVVTLPKAEIHNAGFEWPKVQDALAAVSGGADTSLDALRQLPYVTEKAGEGPITVTLVGNRAVAYEPGDTRDRMFGIAFDVGTTSVVGALMDLNSGEEVATASDLNGQAYHGADVITRMTLTQGGRKNVELLHNAVVDTVNEIIARLLRDARVSRRHVYECVFVGNTVMTHLLLNIDPSKIGFSPFVGVAKRQRDHERGRAGNKPARGPTPLFVFPNIASYVGADILAGMISTRLEPVPTGQRF